MEGLNNNHSLYGFHFENNSGYVVDENGFLKELKEAVQTQKNNEISNGIEGVQILKNKRNIRDVCWVCEGWDQIEFNYDDNKNLQEKIESGKLFLHLDFDGF